MILLKLKLISGQNIKVLKIRQLERCPGSSCLERVFFVEVFTVLATKIDLVDDYYY